MSYVVIFYTKAVTPIQEFYRTKAEAQKAISEDVKMVQIDYKGTGYKKVGSIKSGRISFVHPCYGTDYLVKLEENTL